MTPDDPSRGVFWSLVLVLGLCTAIVAGLMLGGGR